MRFFSLFTAVVTAAPITTFNTTLIAYTQRRIKAGDKSFNAAYAAVVAAGDVWLNQGPWSVTAAHDTPPSGDKHDYFSYARYGWPCNEAFTVCRVINPAGCNMSSGLPWELCDGHANGISNAQSAAPLFANVTASLQALSFAYLFSGKAEYATKAAEIARAWFVTESTRMNPNLNYAQMLPPNEGEWYGVMDLTTNFATVLDAIAFLEPSGAWTPADEAGLIDWCRNIVTWLKTSPQGVEESTQTNNHQTHYRTVTTACLLWTGDAAGAGAELRGTAEPPPAGFAGAPIGYQIWANGELPAEEIRTNSLGYFMYDLEYLFMLGIQSRAAPVRALGDVPDLLTYVSKANHSSIKGVVDFALPYMAGKAWPWRNIDNTSWSQAGAFEMLRRAAHAGWPNSSAYGTASNTLPGLRNDAALAMLFWPWPLLSEEDSIA